MSVPDYEELMLPVLETIANGKIYGKRDLDSILADLYRLSEAERNQTVATGSNLFGGRVHWAITYMVNAGLVVRPERGHVQITKRGKEVLKSGVKRIDNRFLSKFPEFQHWKEKPRQGSREKKGKPLEQLTLATLTPEEQVDAGYQQIREALTSEILDKVKTSSPSFFERLVVQLLTRMGYGGSLPEAGQIIGKSGDGGIDGLIKEDKLGLDVIYVQAKRWEAGVGRPMVQAFAGSLEGQRARKGVMITTSQFSPDAKEYVSRIEKKIVLIDGYELARLMIEYDVGVTTVNTYAIKRIDSDYFEED